MAEKFLKQYQILYKKACVDLESARILLYGIEKKDESLDLEVVFFHLQQAAEKFLKALCSYKKVHVGKTHDISNIIEIIINNEIECPDYINEFGVLTQYAVEGRYAVIHDDYHDAGKFLELMNKFKAFTDIFLKIDLANS